VALALTATGLGCAKKPAPTPPRLPREVDVPAYMKDTVGEVARVAGRELVPVQGLGLVTGLDGTGTTVMPPGVRAQILEIMRKNHVPEPEKILAGPENAVVVATGMLPPGCTEGEEFDLEVRAVPNTETTSLEGGHLLACELYKVSSERGADMGAEAIAIGRGPVFVSPFPPEKAAAKATVDMRVGRVLAGGQALKPRMFRLALLTPSVRTAEQITRLVNARFPDAVKTTKDPGRLDLAVPKPYADDKDHFLDLVGSLYVRETPDARDQRMALLVESLKEVKDADRIALGLETFGGAVLPKLKPLVDDPSEVVRFNVGRILARLQDAEAVHVLEPLALDEKSEFQEAAVKALGELTSGNGLGVLGRTLDAKNNRVRIAAWKAMMRLSPQAFSRTLFHEKFLMTVVQTHGDPFIYFSRTEKPHVAVFGDVRVKPPVIVETRRVMASAVAGSETLVLMSRRHGADLKVESSLEVKAAIEKMAAPFGLDKNPLPQGLNLGYSDVVGIVSEMAKKGALTGPIVLQPLEYEAPTRRPPSRPVEEPGILSRPTEAPAAPARPAHEPGKPSPLDEDLDAR
jgi:hypothetical protein